MRPGNPTQERTAEDRERARAERERRRRASGQVPPAVDEPLSAREPSRVSEPSATRETLVHEPPSANELAQPPVPQEPPAVDSRPPKEMPIEFVARGDGGPGEPIESVARGDGGPGEPIESVARGDGGSGERIEPAAHDEGEPGEPEEMHLEGELDVPGASSESVAPPDSPPAVESVARRQQALRRVQRPLPRIEGAAPRVARPRRPSRARLVVLLVGVIVVVLAIAAIVLVRHSSHTTESPPPAVAIVRVTIPEGETRAQIAQIAASKGLRGSYLKASRHSTLLSPAHYGAPHGTDDLEGFLFPATYELYAGSQASRLVTAQLTAFGENFGPTEVRRARALHVTPYQLLIVASMVEREALLEHDRPRVAAVIYNRLHIGMALGIDSTIRYALHDYTKPLTEAQLRIDSPYNTRTHIGLPPTPISNPGLASIHAAAYPAHVPYLYYVNGADGCGELVFSTSEAQFEHDAAAYHEALARNGGRVPSCHRR